MDFKQIDLRPSKVPGFAKCPSFVMVPKAKKDSGGAAASVGTCIHEIFEKVITTGATLNDDLVNAYAQKHGVDYDGYNGVKRKIYRLQEKYNDRAARFFNSPDREMKIKYTMQNGYPLQGTLDLGQNNGDFGVVLDLKTGESETIDNMPQIKTYSLMYFRKFEYMGMTEVYGFIFNPVLEYYEVQKWNSEELIEWEKFLLDQMGKVGEVYNPGSHCTYCPNLLSCPSHVDMAKSLLEVSGLNSATLPPVKRSDIGKMRPVIQWMKKIIDAYDDFEKSLVAKGPIDLGDGTEVYEFNNIQKIFKTDLVMDAMHEFRGHLFDESKFIASLKINRDTIDTLIGDSARKGMKGKDKKRFIEILNEKNCFDEKPITKRLVRQKEKANELENQ